MTAAIMEISLIVKENSPTTSSKSGPRQSMAKSSNMRMHLQKEWESIHILLKEKRKSITSKILFENSTANYYFRC